MASISTSMSSLTMNSKELITAVCYLGNSVAPANKSSGADELLPPHGWAEPFLQPCRPPTALRLSDALATSPSSDLDMVVEARRLRRTSLRARSRFDLLVILKA